jgi:hypothetical protein
MVQTQKSRLFIVFLAVALAVALAMALLGACTTATTAPAVATVVTASTAPTAATVATTVPDARQPSPPAATRANSPVPAQLIQPNELVYVGAFRLPDGPEEIGWAWSGEALTYYPGGDPSGPDDGYPGSLFGTGHNWNQWVSEISIPVPINSREKDVEELSTATTLQDFSNIRASLFAHLDFEIPRVGLEYLPAQGEQATGKLHFCWGQHLQEEDQGGSHGWCELDLSDPQPTGAWYVGENSNYSTNDYLFAIPQAWADANTPGMYLATGRFRDGGWSGQGPSLFAYGPWNQGNPPAPGSRLQAIPLLLYDSSHVETPDARTMDGYSHSDEWTGGAWLTTAGDRPGGQKSAVILVGTKGQGDCWYGNPDGPCMSCEDRGWWSEHFVGQILFYDPSDLAAVANGEMEAWEPQPYATLDIDQHLYNVGSGQQTGHIGAASFDRERGLLYAFEPLADGDKPLVHAWKIDG